MKRDRAFTLWMTGLSGAGKSTLASALVPALRERGCATVEILDGDALRKTISADLGFTKEDRDTHIRRVMALCEQKNRERITCLAAVISPYRAIRDEARATIAHFIELFVRCSLSTLVQRDVKGLYRKALAGEIPNFTGISHPYEEPVTPEIIVNTDMETLEQSAGKVLSYLEQRAWIAVNGH